MSVTVEVSYGELIDKITILEIKAAKVSDLAKLVNISKELEILQKALSDDVRPSQQVTELTNELRAVNGELWEIEDRIRDKERSKTFDEEFIALARSVYITNDKRARIKRELNEALDSDIVEEKDYQPY
jgi:Asp-tRNA(Asn)/Glu-tRNA(Gln) amidotransferase C subunit